MGAIFALMALPLGASAATKLKLNGPQAANAGQALTYVVTAVDRDGKRLTSYRGTVHFNSSDENAELPFDYKFKRSDRGRHSFTPVVFHTAGAQTLRVADVDRPRTSGERGVTVSPGALHHLGVAPDGEGLSPVAPSNTTADYALLDGAPPISRAFSATGFDEYGNSLGSYTSSATFAITPDGSCATNTCGNATSSGDHTVTATVGDAAGQASAPVQTVAQSYGMTCKGENYDVNRSSDDGCEQLQLHTVHTKAATSSLGNKNCQNGITTLTGKILSDGRTHANPSITGYDGSVGSAPNWYRFSVSDFACLSDYGMSLTTTGGSAVVCYKAIFFKGTTTIASLTVSGNGQASTSGQSGGYSSGDDVYFSIEKTCSDPLAQAVNYNLDFYL